MINRKLARQMFFLIAVSVLVFHREIFKKNWADQNISIRW